MTAAEFRNLALELPEAVASSHHGHPDFRAWGKIFATLGYPDKDWGMVKLTPAEQRQFMESEPDVFYAIKGVWGKRGATNVHLPWATAEVLRPALLAAWRNVMPKKVAKEYLPPAE